MTRSANATDCAREDADPWPRAHRITVDEYHRMAYVGLLPSDVRMELLDGVIYEMGPFDPLSLPPYGREYRSIVNQLNRALVVAVGERAIVQCQGTIPFGELCEPQPELALLATCEDGYRVSDPCAADTLLVIEVSDQTRQHDTSTKMSLYARYGVPELWVFDVQGKRLRTYRQPTGSGYDEMQILVTPGIIPITALPNVFVDLSNVFR